MDDFSKTFKGLARLLRIWTVIPVPAVTLSCTRTITLASTCSLSDGHGGHQGDLLTTAYPLAVDVLVGAADTCSPFAERLEFPALATAHWQCVPRPTMDSHSTSGGSRPELQRESMDGPVATSSATTVSIPLGANGSSFPGAPPPERPASERIVKGTP